LSVIIRFGGSGGPSSARMGLHIAIQETHSTVQDVSFDSDQFQQFLNGTI